MDDQNVLEMCERKKMQENELKEFLDRVIEESGTECMSGIGMNDDRDIEGFQNATPLEMMEHCLKYMKIMYSECLKFSETNINVIMDLAAVQTKIIEMIDGENVEVVSRIMEDLNNTIEKVGSNHTNPHLTLSCVMSGFCKTPPEKIKIDLLNKRSRYSKILRRH